MSRVVVIALVLGAPMTIVHTTSRTQPGFRVRLTCQIGCATTGDIPAEADDAVRRPDVLRAWAATPMDMTSQAAYDESHRLIKAKALRQVLDRKPYGEDVLAAAAALSRTESVRDLLMLSSDVQSAELKAVLDLLNGNPDALAYYGPLL